MLLDAELEDGSFRSENLDGSSAVTRTGRGEKYKKEMEREVDRLKVKVSLGC